ncbi:MAG: nucleoside-diphosphate kinase [Nanobdellota archaeon]
MVYNSEISDKVLVLIKPKSVENSEEILDELDQHGERTHTSYLVNVPEDMIREHYKEHEGKGFYEDVVGELSGQPFVLATYQNLDMKVKDFKQNIIGKTNPAEAQEGTIRKMYGLDMTNNGVHCSDPESYNKEVRQWVSYALEQPDCRFSGMFKRFNPEVKYNKPSADLEYPNRTIKD